MMHLFVLKCINNSLTGRFYCNMFHRAIDAIMIAVGPFTAASEVVVSGSSVEVAAAGVVGLAVVTVGVDSLGSVDPAPGVVDTTPAVVEPTPVVVVISVTCAQVASMPWVALVVISGAFQGSLKHGASPKSQFKHSTKRKLGCNINCNS